MCSGGNSRGAGESCWKAVSSLSSGSSCVQSVVGILCVLTNWPVDRMGDIRNDELRLALAMDKQLWDFTEHAWGPHKLFLPSVRPTHI